MKIPSRTNYFTYENIGKKGEEMMRWVKSMVNIKDFKYLPSISAILVIDMQRFFLEEDSHAYIPSGKAIISPIKKLVDRYYKKDLPVIFTRHINDERDVVMARWWGDLIKKENPYSEIVEDFDLSRGFVVEKRRYDAFFDTELEDILKEKRVKQLLISGVLTHLCCETTARSAFMRGYDVFFLVDGTATYNEDFHRGSILNLSHGFAIPVLSEDIKRRLDEDI